MPWRWGFYKGKRVLLRAHADGSPAFRDGRLDIRFREGDSRVYPARPDNVRPISLDEAPLVHEEVSEERPSAASQKKPAAPRAARPAGDRGAHTHAKAADHEWVAYTDGACTGNPGPAGCGYVILAPDGRRAEAYDYLGEATNNVAELTAILHALAVIPKAAHALVHTDSQYAIGVLTKGWKAKANVELVANIKDALRGRSVRFAYVPGHSGIPLNERADELAREAIRVRRSRPPKLDPGA